MKTPSGWKPGTTIEQLQARAQMLNSIRQFFHCKNVMEVETPLLASAGVTDPHLINFNTEYHLPGESEGANLYLQTSPEYAMKRLLCAGSGSIYQICKAFRNEEQGRFHNPEFTILEWYRTGFDHWQLMDEMEELISMLLHTKPFQRLSWQQAFINHLGFDPLPEDDETLKAVCKQQGFADFVERQEPRDTLLQLLFSHVIEPKIGQSRPCFVYHFPASQAALARISETDHRVAERFELYYRGIELANGFHELNSAKEQQQRFEQDNALRVSMGLAEAQIDHHLIDALHAGLPDCAGVALGLDRLLMLLTDTKDIDEVLSFSVKRV